jgi:CRP-like cAMP-binding protein
MKLDPLAFLANPDLIEALKERSIEVACGGEYYLFRQGEPPVGLYILLEGEVTLSMTGPAGELLLSMQVGAGSLLGLPGLISNEPYTLTAMACNGARVSFVSQDDFKALMQTHPGLALKVLEVLAAEVRTARQATQDLRPSAAAPRTEHQTSSHRSGADNH